MDGLIKKENPKKYLASSPHGIILPEETRIPSAQYNENLLFRPKRKTASQQKRFLPKHFFLFAFLAFFLLSCFAVAFALYKGVSLGREIQIENTSGNSFFADMKHLATALITTKSAPLLGEENGRINILLLGRAGNHYPGKNLTDTIMILSINTKERKVALLSLPRDLYVEIPGTELFIKLNALYQYGLSNGDGIRPLRTAIENITGEEIHYFFTLDFDGFEKVVDALHGISVDVVRDFYDPRYPGKNYSYETFEIKKGWQTLDGATTLKYVRERHNDPDGDFGRAKRQQQVISAIKEKAFSLGTLFNIVMINNILHVLGESVQTDMPPTDMEGLLTIIRTLDTKNITTFVVDAWKKESLLRVSHVVVGDVSAFILVPRIGTWNEIRDVSNHIFHLEDIKLRRKQIESEHASLTLITTLQNKEIAQKIETYLLEEVGFEKVEISITSLENIEEKSMIQDRTNMRKPFSLDELLKKLSLEKCGTLPLPSSSPTTTTDFSLIIGQDLLQEFSLDETIKTDIPEEDSSFEILPPQKKHSKR